MRVWVHRALVGLTGFAVGCSLSNLDAVSRKPTPDGGLADGGLADGNGGDVLDAGGDGSSPSVACPTPGLSPGDTNETILVGSTTRSYFLHVPSAYDGTKPVPLVVDFHFLGNSGAQELRISPFPTVADSEGVIVVFPDGLAGPAGTAWNLGPCCVPKEIDDVAFAKALVTQLRARACIDAKRVYAVGYALGGGMTHHLGCHAADVFAAIAPVGFDLVKENLDGCKPSRPITVVAFRELSDAFVPYEGGVFSTVPGMSMTLLGAKPSFAAWAAINQCAGAPTAEDVNGCSTYGACGGGVEVVLCTKQAGAPVPSNGSIAWPILKRHLLP